MMSRLFVLATTAILLVGCGTMGPEMWVSTDPTKVQQESYECERDARMAGSTFMDMSPLMRAITGIKSTQELYMDCMKAKGYQQKQSDNR